MLAAAIVALVAWLAILVLPWQPHRTRERLEPDESAEAADLGDVIAIVPARDEVASIERTLAGLASQGSGLRAIVVDDQSSDGTLEAVERFARNNRALAVRAVAGRPLPAGWAGKLWALEQGFAHADRPYTLLIDADIELAPGTVAALVAVLRERRADLASVMAELACTSAAERLLAPPFVFFFKLLYPFALINDVRSRVAGAAGGCMLVRTQALRSLGGFAPIKSALIDDCTLAAAIKRQGGALWLGLSHAVRSTRSYDLDDFWRMVTRSAFTQLRRSTWLLLAVTCTMLAMFAAPVAALASGRLTFATAGGAALAAMCVAYLPIVRFYALPAWWTLTLPAAGLLFLAMTWSSAINDWRGRRATWKNRHYGITD